MQDDTRAMAENAITMVAAEYTENGWAADGLRPRIASIAEYADIRHNDLRPLLLVGWEEGAVCRLAGHEKQPSDLAQLVIAARYLGLTNEELLETNIGGELDRLGLLKDDSEGVSETEIAG